MPANSSSIERDPNEYKLYGFEVIGDTHVSSTWIVESSPAGATWKLAGAGAASADGTPYTPASGIAGSKVLFGEVSAEGTYKLTCRMTGGSGQKHEWHFYIAIKN